jgi:polysaccharide export outer membrane protein
MTSATREAAFVAGLGGKTVLLLALIAVLTGCVTSKVPTSEGFEAPPAVTQLKDRYAPGTGSAAVDSSPVNLEESAAGRYRLGPGDQLTVVIQRVPGATYDVAVRPDGFISLPVVDEVRAAGLTPAQLDEHLTELFSDRFVDPELSVIVRALRQPMVYVLGKVRSPGAVPHSQASSAAEAVSRAGDVLPIADVSNVAIIRLGDDGVIRSLPLKTAANDGVFSFQAGPYMVLAATQLEPEDIVFVPERGFARLGTDLQQLFSPVTAVSGAISSLLNPWLLWEILDDLTSDGDTGFGVNIQ